MIDAVKTFLTLSLSGLLLQDGVTAPFRPADPDNPDVLQTIYFDELPRDFLKDHDYAAQCLPLQDRKRTDGRLIGRERNAEGTHYLFTRRRFRREILFRCFLWARTFEDLWGGSGFVGLVDQFEQVLTQTKVISDAGNNAVTVAPHDAVRPWNSETAADRVSRRSHLAICRVEFIGGIHTTESVPIVPSIEFVPSVG